MLSFFVIMRTKESWSHISMRKPYQMATHVYIMLFMDRSGGRFSHALQAICLSIQSPKCFVTSHMFLIYKKRLFSILIKPPVLFYSCLNSECWQCYSCNLNGRCFQYLVNLRKASHYVTSWFPLNGKWQNTDCSSRSKFTFFLLENTYNTDVKYIWNNSYIWTAVVDQSEEWSLQ